MKQGLGIVPVDTPKIPEYQIVIRVGSRSHPLLTLQPPPNNPDVPLKKMKGLRSSPYSNGSPRQGIVKWLNAILPEAEQKPDAYRDQFFTIHWHHLADPVQFARIRGVLDRIVSEVRKGWAQS